MTNEELETFEQQNAKLLQITREQHGHRAYAQARFDLGKNYYQMGNVEKAILILQSIQAKDYPELYAHAQFHIGSYYYELGYHENAIQMWLHIQPSHGELYGHTQYSLGNLYFHLAQYHKAFDSWKNIKFKDGKDLYINAIFAMSSAYVALNQSEQAVLLWQSLQQHENEEIAMTAHYNLGNLYDDLKQHEYAIQTWSHIPNTDSLYTSAQFNIGNAYITLKQPELAIQAWQNISEEQTEIYAYVQQMIGQLQRQQNTAVSTSQQESADVVEEDTPSNDSILVDEKSRSETQLPHSTAQQLSQLEPLQQAYALLNQQVVKLQTLLQINTEDVFEQQVFFKIPANQFIAELQRPTLYLHSLNEQEKYIKNSVLMDFMAIPDLFQQQSFMMNQRLAFLKPLSLNVENTQQDNNSVESIFAGLYVPLLISNQVEHERVMKLYRCVYIDPKTHYVQLAQRNKWSFYQEYSTQKTREDIEHLWQQYQQSIAQKEQQVYDVLQQLKQNVQRIIAIYPHREAINTLTALLSPLLSLMQHAKGSHRAECQWCYFTTWNDEALQREAQQTSLFVASSTSLTTSLKDVYLPSNVQAIYPFMLKLFEGQLNRLHWL